MHSVRIKAACGLVQPYRTVGNIRLSIVNGLYCTLYAANLYCDQRLGDCTMIAMGEESCETGRI